MDKVNKNFLIDFPVRISGDELAILQHLLKYDLNIFWNGKDLRGRGFVGAKYMVQDKRNPELLKTEVIHSCVEKKLLLQTQHEKYKKDIMVVNPLVVKTVTNQLDKTFKFGDKEVELFKHIEFSIPNDYLIPFGKTMSLKITKSFMQALFENQIILDYVFKMEDKYFVVKNKELQQVKPIFMKNQFKIEQEKSKNKTDNDQDKEISDKAKEISESLTKNLDIEGIVKDAFKKEQEEKERIRKEKEVLKKEKVVEKEILTEEELDTPIFKKQEKDSKDLGYSISKFKKPIKKISVDNTKDFEGKYKELLDFYIKNFDIDSITPRQINEMRGQFFQADGVTVESANVVKDIELVQGIFSNHFYNLKYEKEDFIGVQLVCSKNKYAHSRRDMPKNKNDVSINVLILVHKTRKVPTKFMTSFYHISSQVFPKAVKEDFAMVTLKSGKFVLYKESLLQDLLKYGEFSDPTEIEILKKIAYNNFSYSDKYDVDVKNGVYEKAYYSLYTMFIDRISEDNRLSNRKVTESYAKSFEEKKHITQQNQDVMSNNKFLGKQFKYVELDNDSDLNKFKVLEQDFENIMDKLPNLPRPIDLRFRKLGNIRVGSMRGAGGVYFPYFETLCVDLDNTLSFVHEYGHAYDFLNGSVENPLSNAKNFQHIVNGYRKTLIENSENTDMPQSDLSYYCDSAEVFARAFETYMLDKLPFNSLMKPDLEKIVYTAFDSLENEITEYFDNLFK